MEKWYKVEMTARAMEAAKNALRIDMEAIRQAYDGANTEAHKTALRRAYIAALIATKNLEAATEMEMEA